MPALLLATAAETTETTVVGGDLSTSIMASPTPRSKRRPLAIVVGLVMLSTVLLVALAIVALGDRTDSPIAESDPGFDPGSDPGSGPGRADR